MIEPSKIAVLKVAPHPWRREGPAVSKEIHLHTELGLRVYLLYIGYGPDHKPMLMLRFNFSWGIAGPGAFFGFVLRRQDEVLALTAVERKTSEPSTDMVSFDEVGITGVMLALATHSDLVAELHGPDGVNIDFPIPADETFYPTLRSVLTDVTEKRSEA